ncbi:MAG: branched-chain amino acid ABC transporter permease [Proteobacteria bacterium]|nr:branched-chain amino acid ABC transporter permease [Pseudomonadota bacterium]MDA1058827.1 branched-chain amino acid ABC transporter permease [Pseudomonadota bacterium]
MNIVYVIEDSLTGLMTGGVYALIAVGIVFVFRATKVFNFAHGTVMMIGAYFYYTITVVLGDLGLGTWAIYVLGVPLTLLVSALFGAAIERIVMRPMLGQNPFAMIMVTIGLISVLEGSAAVIWSTNAKFPPALVGLNIDFVAGMAINRQMLASFLIAGIVFAAITVLFLKSKAGVAIRATASDQSTAYAMGINVPRVFSVTWMVAAGTGALAGVLLAPLNSLTPGLGQVGLSVIAVVILGGLDSVIGVLLAAFIVGWLEAMANHFLGGDFKEVVPYAVVLLIILIRPYGLLGTRDVERV